ncbi:hypothetical protein [Treponema maltophilum]|uniref:hypothetical protein n=1 Tax=Treponema maltophilum TaxID=51160 RepID=UPI003D8B713F
MKKHMLIIAVITTVLIGLTGCPNAAQNNLWSSFSGKAVLSCYVNMMGGVDFGIGQPNLGNKYKSIMEDVSVAVDEHGQLQLIVKFRKSAVRIFIIDAYTFIDPRNSTPGYYDMDGVKQNAVYTLSKAGDTATPPPSDPDHAAGVQYVTSMTFPVSKDKDVYKLWIYINSNIMGVQFCDGNGTAKANHPNEATPYVGKIKIDWSKFPGQ